MLRLIAYIPFLFVLLLMLTIFTSTILYETKYLGNDQDKKIDCPSYEGKLIEFNTVNNNLTQIKLNIVNYPFKKFAFYLTNQQMNQYIGNFEYNKTVKVYKNCLSVYNKELSLKKLYTKQGCTEEGCTKLSEIHENNHYNPGIISLWILVTIVGLFSLAGLIYPIMLILLSKSNNDNSNCNKLLDLTQIFALSVLIALTIIIYANSSGNTMNSNDETVYHLANITCPNIWSYEMQIQSFVGNRIKMCGNIYNGGYYVEYTCINTGNKNFSLNEMIDIYGDCNVNKSVGISDFNKYHFVGYIVNITFSLNYILLFDFVIMFGSLLTLVNLLLIFIKKYKSLGYFVNDNSNRHYSERLELLRMDQ